MVNFRIHGNFDHLFNNLVIPKEEDWVSLEPKIFLGRYIREKSTGLLYRAWGLYQHPNFKTQGYNIRKSLQDPHFELPDHFPSRLPSQGLKDIYRNFTLPPKHITIDILFRNKEEYLKAEKDLNICQTHVLEIPIVLSQLKSHIPQIYKRFESPIKNMEKILYLYKPRN